VEFALKRIDLGSAKMPVSDALKEVQAMRSLPSHRNIVQLHDHWENTDHKVLWLLMDLCTRGTLTSAIDPSKSARMSDDGLLDLCRQLLDALRVFEENHLVHNDIKPDNIFITADGTPKIGDLGLARATLHRVAGSVLTSVPGATLVYASPEVLSKMVSPTGGPLAFPQYRASPVSYQSDVYSVGVSVWHCIMQRHPDRVGGATPLTSAHVANATLRGLVNEMLQLDPASRPRASALLLKYFKPGAPLRPPSAAPSRPASTASVGMHIGRSVCIRRDDGQDRTLLRVRPTCSRDDDAFVTPHATIFASDRLVLIDTRFAEGTEFSYVRTKSGVEGYVQSKYIVLAPV
jgi:serine/threonine protein kinase